MNEISSTIKRTTFSHCFFEGMELLAFQLLLGSGVREYVEGRTCGFGIEPDVKGGDAGVSSQLHGCIDGFLLNKQTAENVFNIVLTF